LDLRLVVGKRTEQAYDLLLIMSLDTGFKYQVSGGEN